MKKREWLIFTIIFLIGALINGVLFMLHPDILYLVFGVLGAIGTGHCLSKYIDIKKAEAERRKGRKCRMCGVRKVTMALTYGEDEGLCRECLDELLPLIDNLEMKAEK